MNIGERIKEQRLHYGYTLEQLAKKVGTSKQTIQRYESGVISNIPSDKIEKMASALLTTPAYLMGWTNNCHSNTADNIINVPSNSVPYEPQNILIPKLGSVSAGLGCLADNEIIGYESFSASSIKADEKYMCLDVHGDSMFPMLLEGDIVLVQCQTSVDSGSIAVVTVNGDEGVIKKIVYGSDWIELHSINPMYPVRRFEGKDVLKIRVMGLVKELKRKF